MLFVGVKYKTEYSNLPELEETLKGINGRKVQIGVASSDSWLASIHEY